MPALSLYDWSLLSVRSDPLTVAVLSVGSLTHLLHVFSNTFTVYFQVQNESSATVVAYVGLHVNDVERYGLFNSLLFRRDSVVMFQSYTFLVF